MRLRINALNLREISTRHGPTQVYDLVLSDGQAYDCFVASWNADWSTGREIEFDAAQVQHRQKNGRTYLTLNPPQRNGSHGTSPRSGETIRLDAGGLLAAVLDDSHELEIV